MSAALQDLAGRTITCDYCLAFQFRDWEAVEWMQDHGEGCTCEGETED